MEKNSNEENLGDLRRLLIDTISEVNHLKVLMLSPQSFAVFTAHIISKVAAAAAMLATKEFAESKVRAAVQSSRPILLRDRCGLANNDGTGDVQDLGQVCGGGNDGGHERGVGGGSCST